MLWLLYNCLFAVGFILLLPRFAWRMWRRGGYREDFFERVGGWSAEKRARLAGGRRIWVHAVSVGEVQVALCFIKEYRAAEPEAAFVLSTTTSTGHAVAAARLDPRDVLVYFPADFPVVTRRALDLFKPACIMLVESELWPNLIRLAGARGIPVILVNGRISNKSAAGYGLVKLFFREAIGHMSLLCVQTVQDRDRLIGLGADPAKVRVMGAAKYDVAMPDSSAEKKAGAILDAIGMGGRGPVVVGGSTWPGEEAILLDIFGRLRVKHPSAGLVLVPRHAERGDSVAREIEKTGLAFVRRSAMNSSGAPVPPGVPVLLVDTTGELVGYYARADVVFVGKSLTEHGGQNIIEPAMLGKPVIAGPHMENFAEVADDFTSAEALFRVPDAAGLERTLESLLADGELRAVAGRRAREMAEKKRGSVRETVNLVRGETRKAKLC